MSITTATAIEIDLAKESKGNFLVITDVVNPDLDPSDSIYGLVLKTDFSKETEVHGGYLRPLDSVLQGEACRELKVMVGDKVKLLLVYNLYDGQYEVTVNNYSVKELPKLSLEVHRWNTNRVPRAVPA